MDLSTFPKLDDGFSQQTTAYVNPEKLDEFWRAFLPTFEKAVATPECLYFEVFEDPAVPRTVTWIVNWNASVEWVMTKSNFERTIGENNEGPSLHVSIELKPGTVEEFFETWRKVYPPVAGEEECLYFEVFSDPTQPTKLSWVENWSKSVEWLMSVQLTKEYYKPYLAATEPLCVGERQFSLLKRKEGLVAFKEANFEGSFVGDY